MSMCILENLASGVLNLPSGAVVWRWIFDFWHWMQDLVQLRTSLLMLGQIYLDVMRCCVARMLGCDNECKESNTVRRNWCGMYGRGTFVDISQSSLRLDVGNGSGCNCREDVDNCNCESSESDCCASAIALKSMTGGD